MKTKNILRVLVIALVAMTGIVGIVNANEIKSDRSETFMDIYFNETTGVHNVEVFYVDYTTHEKVDLGVCYRGNAACSSDDVWFEFVNDGKIPLTIKGMGTSSVHGNVGFAFKVEPGYKSSTKLLDGEYNIWVNEYPELKRLRLIVEASTYPCDNGVRRVNEKCPEVVPTVIIPEQKVIATSIPQIPKVIVSDTVVKLTVVKPTDIAHIGPIITPNVVPVVTSQYIDPYNPAPGQMWGVDEAGPGTPSGFLRFVGRVVGRGIKEVGNGLVGGFSN